MPMMDMRTALLDPYLVDRFTVIRRQEVVSSNGISVLSTTSTLNVAGVVTAGNPSKLDRQPNMDISDKWIDVVTQFPLYAESESGANTEYKPDIIQWHGNNYIVKTLADYSSYGPGFVSVQCALMDSQATPTGNGN